jgi:hypothetical protein
MKRKDALFREETSEKVMDFQSFRHCFVVMSFTNDMTTKQSQRRDCFGQQAGLAMTE